MYGWIKYIRLCFFLRDLVKDREMELVHCVSEKQVPYLMTKALKFETFQELKNKIKMLDYAKVN